MFVNTDCVKANESQQRWIWDLTWPNVWLPWGLTALRCEQITKVIIVHPEGNKNAWAFHHNPFNSCWDLWVCTTVDDKLTGKAEATSTWKLKKNPTTQKLKYMSWNGNSGCSKTVVLDLQQETGPCQARKTAQERPEEVACCNFICQFRVRYKIHLIRVRKMS